VYIYGIHDGRSDENFNIQRRQARSWWYLYSFEGAFTVDNGSMASTAWDMRNQWKQFGLVGSEIVLRDE
jgi:hypothetical protein